MDPSSHQRYSLQFIYNVGKKGDTKTKGIRRYFKSKFLFIRTINESVSAKGTRLTKEIKLRAMH